VATISADVSGLYCGSFGGISDRWLAPDRRPLCERALKTTLVQSKRPTWHPWLPWQGCHLRTLLFLSALLALAVQQ